ncbi:type II toxin-antitoxin system mRNA interferase toxin, RelE/StbE family [Candidatus Roizmanbacteria bacterium]|nr:type II toxin-antitoxin system mRNA interferase toxin, RelE/StbE family [Candidatus Roizmanbacteria bacterium]
MKIHYHKDFIKSYRKRILRNVSLDKRFKERLKLFIENNQSSILKDHVLKGRKLGYRAFSITGDIRVIYEEVDDGVLLLDIGTHNQVY